MKVVTFENYFCHRSLGLGVKELMVSRVGTVVNYDPQLCGTASLAKDTTSKVTK